MRPTSLHFFLVLLLVVLSQPLASTLAGPINIHDPIFDHPPLGGNHNGPVDHDHRRRPQFINEITCTSNTDKRLFHKTGKQLLLKNDESNDSVKVFRGDWQGESDQSPTVLTATLQRNGDLTILNEPDRQNLPLALSVELQPFNKNPALQFNYTAGFWMDIQGLEQCHVKQYFPFGMVDGFDIHV